MAAEKQVASNKLRLLRSNRLWRRAGAKLYHISYTRHGYGQLCSVETVNSCDSALRLGSSLQLTRACKLKLTYMLMCMCIHVCVECSLLMHRST